MMISQLMNGDRVLATHPGKADYFSALRQKFVILSVAAFDWLYDRFEQQREMAELSRFSDRELKDIGLMRHETGRDFDASARQG